MKRVSLKPENIYRHWQTTVIGTIMIIAPALIPNIPMDNALGIIAVGFFTTFLRIHKNEN